MIDLDGRDIERVQKTCRGWAVYLMTIHMGRWIDECRAGMEGHMSYIRGGDDDNEMSSCRWWVESMQGDGSVVKTYMMQAEMGWVTRGINGWVGVRESNRGKGIEWMWEWRMIGGQENVSDAKRVRNRKTQCRKKMMRMRMRETMRWAESLWNPDWNKSIEEYKTCKLIEKLG